MASTFFVDLDFYHFRLIFCTQLVYKFYVHLSMFFQCVCALTVVACCPVNMWISRKICNWDNNSCSDVICKLIKNDMVIRWL